MTDTRGGHGRGIEPTSLDAGQHGAAQYVNSIFAYFFLVGRPVGGEVDEVAYLACVCGLVCGGV